MPDSRHLQLGARLRFPIFDDNEVLLLRDGAVLTSRLIELLERRGVQLHFDASLVVAEGAQVGTCIAIPANQSVSVGRSADCVVRPSSRAVSGRHCVFYRLGLTLQVRDLGSTNGTFVNGNAIDEPTELGDRDTVMLGDLLFRVTMGATLSSDDSTAGELAQLILATQDGTVKEPTESATIATLGDDRALQRLDEAWQRRMMA